MVGVGKAINKVYEVEVSGDGRNTTGLHVNKKDVTDRSKDIKGFIDLMQPDEIFKNKPWRKHEAFPDFEFGILKNVNPKKLRARLVRLRTELAKRVHVINQMQDD